MRIVYMGTPEFAVPPLRQLVEDGHEVCGVFTQPDKPKNRGMKLTFSPVKEYALTQNIPVFQPQTMRDGEAMRVLQQLAPELVVVAAYGKILPEEMLALPRHGCINIHGSLLPRYRGAAPVNWAILDGEKETGITMMYMARECDAGDIIALYPTPIDPQEDAAALMQRLSLLGAQALRETVSAIENGTVRRTPQDASLATHAPMLSRALSNVDWARPAQKIADQVRGLAPWPCAVAQLDGKPLKLWRAEVLERESLPVGAMRADKRGLVVGCGDGNALLVTELQAEGGKRMAAADYLRGHPLKTER